MRLLVTGGAGYIGSHILTELLPLGHEVCVLDDFSNSKHVILDQVRKLTASNFRFHKSDLCDFNSVKEVCDEFQPQAVIHLAGLKAVGESVLTPLSYYEKNITGSIQLLKAMDSCGCKTIIFSSSATVYAQSDTPIDESEVISPSNPYGRTKYFIEEIVSDWTQTDPSKAAVILRYFNPVGAHKSGEIGENPIGEPNNLMPLLAQVGSGRRPVFNVFGDDYDTKDGTAIRDYIHVLDLAAGHIAGLKYASSNVGLDIFNLGSGIGRSVIELICEFEKVTGSKIPFEIRRRRAGDICRSVANANKAFRVLGWKTQFTLREICEDAWGWQTKYPEGL